MTKVNSLNRFIFIIIFAIISIGMTIEIQIITYVILILIVLVGNLTYLYYSDSKDKNILLGGNLNERCKLKKQIAIFLAITFGVQYLMAIPLYIAKTRGMDISIFPFISMHLPALGVMVALLVTRRDKDLPKIFYLIYFAGLLSLIALCGVYFYNIDLEINILMYFLCLLFSSFSLLSIIAMGKEKRKHYGLDNVSFKKVMLVSLIFIALYFSRIFVGFVIDEKDCSRLLDLGTLLMIILFLIGFFLSFLPFLGEEYGWRYYFQPILQEKFGMVKGVIVLGILWGLWHLPLNLFFYSAEGSGLLSLLNQIVNCVTSSIFMAYAYNKTKSIWAPTLIHYINNNFMIILVKDLPEVKKIGQNMDYTITGVIFTLVFGIILFGPFAFSKYVRKEEYIMPNANEMADEACKELEEEISIA